MPGAFTQAIDFAGHVKYGSLVYAQLLYFALHYAFSYNL